MIITEYMENGSLDTFLKVQFLLFGSTVNKDCIQQTSFYGNVTKNVHLKCQRSVITQRQYIILGYTLFGNT